MKRNAFFLILLMLLSSISAWATVYSLDLIPDLAIPDATPAGVNSTINVPDAGDVTNVKVGVDITHTFDGDLIITLTHGSNTIILSNRRGSSGDNFVGTIFDDAAATTIALGTSPFTGAYSPDQSFTPFIGVNNASGDWILNVSDVAGQDIGTLNSWYIDLTITNPVPMTFTSCTTSQNSAIVWAGDTNQEVIGIEVVMSGSLTPLNLTQFTLNANGSTAASDISNAKIYYTGTNSVFSAINQFGSTVASPTLSNFLVSGTQTLVAGTNHFWLTYDIPILAVYSHVIDGECGSLTIAGVPHIPTVTAPAGNRLINVPLSGTKTIALTGGDYASFTDAINALNSLGVGAGGVTFNVTSGNTFTEDPPVITATGASDRPIIFQKSSTTHAIIKPTGGGGANDAGIAINGGDYITFDGIDISEVTTSTAVEYGYYLYGTSTNGAQHNTIKNTSILLSRQNPASMAIHSYSIASTAAGANSYNKFYSITATGQYSGIDLTGSTTSGAEDTGNEVGTTSGVNTLSNLGYTSGTTAAYGVYAYAQTNAKIFSTNVVTAAGSSGSLYGIYLAGSPSTVDVYLNAITNFSTVSGSAYGIYVTSGNTYNIYKNTIYTLSATGVGSYGSYGIYVAGGTTSNIYNNMIRALNAVSSSAAPSTAGIYLSGGSTDNLYYNTIMLNSTATGASVSSAGIYTTTTPSTIDMRNNIFVNNSAAGSGASGKSVAFWRNSTGFTNIAAITNNNLYYAGTSGTKNLIFYDGTNSDLTLAAYKSRISTKDQSSVTENPPFISTVNIHIATTTATQVESGGLPITSPIAIIGDYDGNTGANIRSTTSPDIGADEGNFTILDLIPPVVTYTPLGNNSQTSSITLANVLITDASGVNVISGTKPRIYYKKSLDANAFGVANNSTGNGWKWVETASGASPFSFVMNYSLLQSLPVAGDIIQYFLVAQDNVTTPNVCASPSAGFAGTSVSAITAAPTTPNSFLIIASLSGIKTIGTAGNYPTITAALTVLSTAELIGAVEYRLLDTTYPSETFPLTIGAIVGSSETKTITIKPAIGVTGVVITGSNATAIWNLNGATYVTIEGSNNSGTSKDLTIINTITSAPVINFVGASANITIKNCIINGANTGTTSGLIYIATTATGNNNSILSCNLGVGASVPYTGIYIAGSFTGSQLVQGCTIAGMSSYGVQLLNSASNGVIIQQNTIRDFGSYGVYINAGNSPVVNKCDIYSTYLASSTLYGVYIGSVPNAVVKKCKIHNLVGSASATLTGIYVYGANGIIQNYQVCNNEIYLETGASTTTGTVRGIDYYAWSSNSCEIYYNSVYIGGSNVTSGTSAAFSKRDSATTFKVENNIFMNTRSNSTGTGKHYAVAITTIVATTLVLDYNDYYTNGVGGYLGNWSSVDLAAIEDWQSTALQDLNSSSKDPYFSYGTTYLQPYLVSLVFGSGIPITGITDDILDGIRDASYPTVGAYETGVVLTAPNPAVLVSPANGATGQALSSVLHWANGGGLTTSYLIKFGTNNPPTNILNGQDLGMVTSYTPVGLAGGTTYYWQIIPKNDSGSATGCPVWSFSTISSVSAPVNLWFSLSGTAPVLHWNVVSGATGYKVYWTTNPTTPSWTLLGSPTTNSYTDTTMPRPDLRFYKVTATQ